MSSSGLYRENSTIPLEEIHLATKNLSSEARIRKGRFSDVYRGTLSESWKYQEVAMKRLNTYNCGPSYAYEFEDEHKIVSSLKNEHIIPLVGYYNKDEEMIIVSKYANNGSLDYYLRNRRLLTWAQSLKICIGAAKGLVYLHSGLGDHESVIHRDFKSTNILLDDNMEARISGFDFSILVDRRQPQGYKRANGTLSYLDPVYNERGIPNTESDVYSFGVVLFEMLSGMLAYKGENLGGVHPQILINLVPKCYDKGLEKLILGQR